MRCVDANEIFALQRSKREAALGSSDDGDDTAPIVLQDLMVF